VLLAPVAALCCLLAPANLIAGPLEFPPVADFNILSPDGLQSIGHTHFTLTNDAPGFELIYIESHYANGEYDIERNLIEDRGARELPVLADYDHRFFAPGGVLTREDSANFRSGKAACTVLVGGAEEVKSATLDLPKDTYAGSALIIPLQNHLSADSKAPIEFHDLACAPGPRIFKVQAAASALQRWTHYPGKTLEVEITPAFGWLDVVIAPFVPKIRAWFNPADDWNFVGGQFTRYYKGPQILLARVPPAPDKGPIGSPEVATAPVVPPAETSPPALR
jgi:hypothetical protein